MPLDKETLDAIEQAKKDAITESRKLAEEVVANYKKADTWWQAYRRAHPLAVQNIILFGFTPTVGLVCFLVGRAVGAK